MATDDDDELDAEGPPTRPTPSPIDVVDQALADVVLYLQQTITEIQGLRKDLRASGDLTARTRGRLGRVFRRLQSEAGFTAQAVDPPAAGAATRPSARYYHKAKRPTRARRRQPGRKRRS